MKNTFLFLIAAAMLIYGAWWQYQLVQNLQPVEPATAPSVETPEPQQESLSDTIPEKQSSIEVEQPFDSELAIAEQETIEKETQEALDLISGFKPPVLWTSTDQHINKVTSLSFNRESLLGLKQGDTITLPPINGQQWNASVTERSRSSSGNLTLKATLTAWSENYPVIITQGKTHTFATISTPDGIYELEARDSEGTLRPSTAFNEFVDPSVSDIMPTPSS